MFMSRKSEWILASVVLAVLGIVVWQLSFTTPSSAPIPAPTPASPAPAPSPAPAEPAPAPEPPAAAPGGDQVPASSMVLRAARDEIPVYEGPSKSEKVKVSLHGFNDVGQEQPFLVVSEQPGWYEVLLPVRPNGSTGWVSADQVKSERVRHYLLANLKDFRLDHYVDGQRRASYKVGIGKPSTPTPTGLFYVWATQKNPGGVYNPVIFALNGFSPTLTNWPGGGRAGIHGWPDAGVQGKMVSNGCLRLTRADAAALAAAVPVGTPVKIVG